MNKWMNLLLLVFLINSLSNCNTSKGNYVEYTWDTLKVKASAYNSLEAQTQKGFPNIAAWGDTLKPGMRAIAVSRDLLDRGVDHNTPVRIKGLHGIYLVKDKMNKRWTNKIDIYMGTDVEKALQWGVREVTIYIGKPPE